MRISENFESFANDAIAVPIKSSRKIVMANPDSKTSVEPQIEHHTKKPCQQFLESVKKFAWIFFLFLKQDFRTLVE